MERDRELVRRAVAGDAAAVRELVRRLLPVIRARAVVFLSRGGRQVGAEVDDLVQQIWLTLLKDGGKLLLDWDPERGKTLEGYVGMLSQRELWVLRRGASAKKRAGQETSIEDAPVANGRASPEARTVSRDVLGRLLDHLWEKLGEQGRRVLTALYLDGMSPDQAAEALGVTRQVVYNWQHRVRTEARAYLAATPNGNGG